MNTRLRSILALGYCLALASFNTGCVGNALSSAGQAAVNVGGQAVTADILSKHPGDYAALVALYPKLPSILVGGMDSYSLGKTLATFGTGLSTGSSSVIVNALDGTIRDGIAASGGGTGTPSLIQAAAQQAIDVWADGMWHALNVYEGANNLPKTPQVQFSVQVVPVAPAAATSTGK